MRWLVNAAVRLNPFSAEVDLFKPTYSSSRPKSSCLDPHFRSGWCYLLLPVGFVMFIWSRLHRYAHILLLKKESFTIWLMEVLKRLFENLIKTLIFGRDALVYFNCLLVNGTISQTPSTGSGSFIAPMKLSSPSPIKYTPHYKLSDQTNSWLSLFWLSMTCRQ